MKISVSRYLTENLIAAAHEAQRVETSFENRFLLCVPVVKIFRRSKVLHGERSAPIEPEPNFTGQTHDYFGILAQHQRLS
jgi:hypothetical protein